MRSFFALVLRDGRLSFGAGGGAWLAVGFFAAAAVLVPLGLGPDLPLLSRMAGGVLWVLSVLSALLSLDRMFLGDAEDGSLDLLALSPLPLEGVAVAKILAHWLGTGLPLTVLSALLGLMFGLRPEDLTGLCLSLLIGTPAISALGAVGAALTLSVRGNGLLLPLILLPLLSPAVIFGAGAAVGIAAAFWFLAAFAVVAVLLSPFAAAYALRLHLAD